MKNIKQLIAVAIISAVGVGSSPLAMAAYYDGLYFSGFVGVSKALNNTYSDGAKENKYTINSDHGFNIGGAIGYRFDCFRTELGIAYTKNDDKRIDILDANSPSVDSNTGDKAALTFMVNAYYDFINRTGFIPFVGAGIGAAHLRHDYHSGDISMHSNDTVFAYQFIIGIGSDITDRLRINLDYRFIGTTNGNFRINGTSGTPIKVRGDYLNHQINLGLTYFI